MSKLAILSERTETTMARINREVFGGSTDCRKVRMEIRTPDGNRRIYSLNAVTKGEAREEAVQIVKSMVKTFNDERVMWRMAGDRVWSFGAAGVASGPKQSVFKRFFDYFFELNED
ncbi:DUF6018 family natural product bioysynthesis protein [Bacillus cihuensis]|uniref:DUF6018 family natural product bioysynthesis protein n=1 Tax=Bacillus cihuensis TaxID=1208599 RepID=UPI00040930B4|nr:DUF6018 family natural product bioysynthesis protein [Bacillus cihuensis]